MNNHGNHRRQQQQRQSEIANGHHSGDQYPPSNRQHHDHQGQLNGRHSDRMSPARGGASPRRDNSAEKHAHFEKHHSGGGYPLPGHVYDKYTDTMDGGPSRERSLKRPQRGSRYPEDTPIDIDQVTTLYIPKVNSMEGGKTLIRRRRTSSKRRSSSRRKHDRENLNDLLGDEDNHLLPSLRIQRRIHMKSLKVRRVELDEEHKIEAGEYQLTDGQTFMERYHDLKEHDDLSAGNFAELLRNSTLKRMRKIGDWKRPKKLDQYSRRSREIFQHFNLWITSFKVIEGKFGTAVMGYFRFIRWLMFLNLFLMVVMFFVTTVPFLVLNVTKFEETLNTTQSPFHQKAVNCSSEYNEYQHDLQEKESTFEKVVDFLQGTGWMERTVLFYGRYHNRTYTAGDDVHIYNMGLAYILAIGSCFVVSFLLIVKSSAQTVKATFGMESSVAAWTNRVIAGWDYAISNKKAAYVKHTNLNAEFKMCIVEEVLQLKRDGRSANDKATLFFIRFMVNGFVLGFLAGALFLVYFTTDVLLELQKQELNEVLALLIQYLPYLTITVLNFVIPIIFSKVVILEEYTHANALRITLARSILLCLASLGVLIFSLYRLLVQDSDDVTCGNALWEVTAKTSRGSIKCWETYVGQQVYKLVLLDLIVETSIIVFIQLPRRLLYDRFGKTVKLIEKIGPQEFDLPQNVIDIIYSQTLCWLGMFFSPLIPFITFLKCLIFFYLRKWTLLKNCSESDQHYRTSGSSSLFMFVLLFSFLLTNVPVGYMISSIAPSQSCGPFRLYSSADYTMFDTLSNVVKTFPEVLRDIILFLGTVGFFVPVILILCFLMYYFWLLGQGYKKREKLLSDQLKLEAKDKQFLLARVNEVLMNAD